MTTSFCKLQTSLYSCSLCDFMTLELHEFLTHNLDKHKSKFLPCKHCKRLFSKPRYLAVHLVSSHQKKVYRCASSNCNFFSEDPHYFHLHIEKCYKDGYPCFICKKVFLSIESLYLHWEKDSRPQPSRRERNIHAKKVKESKVAGNKTDSPKVEDDEISCSDYFQPISAAEQLPEHHENITATRDIKSDSLKIQNNTDDTFQPILTTEHAVYHPKQESEAKNILKDNSLKIEDVTGDSSFKPIIASEYDPFLVSTFLNQNASTNKISYNSFNNLVSQSNGNSSTSLQTLNDKANVKLEIHSDNEESNQSVDSSCLSNLNLLEQNIKPTSYNDNSILDQMYEIDRAGLDEKFFESLENLVEESSNTQGFYVEKSDPTIFRVKPIQNLEKENCEEIVFNLNDIEQLAGSTENKIKESFNLPLNNSTKSEPVDDESYNSNYDSTGVIIKKEPPDVNTDTNDNSSTFVNSSRNNISGHEVNIHESVVQNLESKKENCEEILFSLKDIGQLTCSTENKIKESFNLPLNNSTKSEPVDEELYNGSYDSTGVIIKKEPPDVNIDINDNRGTFINFSRNNISEYEASIDESVVQNLESKKENCGENVFSLKDTGQLTCSTDSKIRESFYLSLNNSIKSEPVDDAELFSSSSNSIGVIIKKEPLDINGDLIDDNDTRNNINRNEIGIEESPVHSVVIKKEPPDYDDIVDVKEERIDNEDVPENLCCNREKSNSKQHCELHSQIGNVSNDQSYKITVDDSNSADADEMTPTVSAWDSDESSNDSDNHLVIDVPSTSGDTSTKELNTKCVSEISTDRNTTGIQLSAVYYSKEITSINTIDITPQSLELPIQISNNCESSKKNIDNTSFLVGPSEIATDQIESVRNNKVQQQTSSDEQFQKENVSIQPSAMRRFILIKPKNNSANSISKPSIGCILTDNVTDSEVCPKVPNTEKNGQQEKTLPHRPSVSFLVPAQQCISKNTENTLSGDCDPEISTGNNQQQQSVENGVKQGEFATTQPPPKVTFLIPLEMLRKNTLVNEVNGSSVEHHPNNKSTILTKTPQMLNTNITVRQLLHKMRGTNLIKHKIKDKKKGSCKRKKLHEDESIHCHDHNYDIRKKQKLDTINEESLNKDLIHLEDDNESVDGALEEETDFIEDDDDELCIELEDDAKEILGEQQMVIPNEINEDKSTNSNTLPDFLKDKESTEKFYLEPNFSEVCIENLVKKDLNEQQIRDLDKNKCIDTDLISDLPKTNDIPNKLTTKNDLKLYHCHGSCTDNNNKSTDKIAAVKCTDKMQSKHFPIIMKIVNPQFEKISNTQSNNSAAVCQSNLDNVNKISNLIKNIEIVINSPNELTQKMQDLPPVRMASSHTEGKLENQCGILEQFKASSDASSSLQSNVNDQLHQSAFSAEKDNAQNNIKFIHLSNSAAKLQKGPTITEVTSEKNSALVEKQQITSIYLPPDQDDKEISNEQQTTVLHKINDNKPCNANTVSDLQKKSDEKPHVKLNLSKVCIANSLEEISNTHPIEDLNQVMDSRRDLTKIDDAPNQLQIKTTVKFYDNSINNTSEITVPITDIKSTDKPQDEHIPREMTMINPQLKKISSIQSDDFSEVCQSSSDDVNKESNTLKNTNLIIKSQNEMINKAKDLTSVRTEVSLSVENFKTQGGVFKQPQTLSNASSNSQPNIVYVANKQSASSTEFSETKVQQSASLATKTNVQKNIQFINLSQAGFKLQKGSTITKLIIEKNSGAVKKQHIKSFYISPNQSCEKSSSLQNSNQLNKNQEKPEAVKPGIVFADEKCKPKQSAEQKLEKRWLKKIRTEAELKKIRELLEKPKEDFQFVSNENSSSENQPIVVKEQLNADKYAGKILYKDSFSPVIKSQAPKQILHKKPFILPVVLPKNTQFPLLFIPRKSLSSVDSCKVCKLQADPGISSNQMIGSSDMQNLLSAPVVTSCSSKFTTLSNSVKNTSPTTRETEKLTNDSKLKKTIFKILDKSSKMQNKSSEIPDKSSEIQDKSSKIQDKSSKIQDKISAIQDKSSAIQDKSSAIQDKSSAIQDKSSELKVIEDSLCSGDLLNMPAMEKDAYEIYFSDQDETSNSACDSSTNEVLSSNMRYLKYLKQVKSSTSLKSMSKNTDFFKCMYKDCLYSSNNPMNFEHHCTSHNDEINDHCIPIICPYCLKDYPNPLSFIRHCIQSHRKRIFQCSLCFYRACSKMHVSAHLQACHSKMDGAVLIGTPIPLKGIYRTADPVKLYLNHSQMECSMTSCPFVTNSITDMAYHIWKHDPPIKFSCFLCNSEFLTALAWIIHLNVHDIFLLQCLFCSFGCNKRLQMLNHLAIRHADNPLMTYVRTSKHLFYILECTLNTTNSELKYIHSCSNPSSCYCYLFLHQSEHKENTLQNFLGNIKTKKMHFKVLECLYCLFTSRTIKGIEKHLKTEHCVESQLLQYFHCVSYPLTNSEIPSLFVVDQKDLSKTLPIEKDKVLSSVNRFLYNVIQKYFALGKIAIKPVGTSAQLHLRLPETSNFTGVSKRIVTSFQNTFMEKPKFTLFACDYCRIKRKSLFALRLHWKQFHVQAGKRFVYHVISKVSKRPTKNLAVKFHKLEQSSDNDCVGSDPTLVSDVINNSQVKSTGRKRSVNSSQCDKRVFKKRKYLSECLMTETTIYPSLNSPKCSLVSCNEKETPVNESKISSYVDSSNDTSFYNCLLSVFLMNYSCWVKMPVRYFQHVLKLNPQINLTSDKNSSAYK